MNAQMISHLVWASIQEFGAITVDELITKAVENGAKPDKVEGQVKGAIRQLEIKQLITEQTGSENQRFYILSKKGEKEVRKAEKKLNAPERGEMYETETTIRLTAISLAGSIPQDNTDQGRLEWPRENNDPNGRIVLFPVWIKGMFRKVFERIDIIPRYVADWLMFDPITLDAQTTWIKIPVPPDPGSNSGGKGVNTYEALPVGTEITIKGIFPGRTIPKEKSEALWRLAGRVGFSVGKSKLGFGTFEVVSHKVLGDVTLDAFDLVG